MRLHFATLGIHGPRLLDGSRCHTQTGPSSPGEALHRVNKNLFPVGLTCLASQLGLICKFQGWTSAREAVGRALPVTLSFQRGGERLDIEGKGQKARARMDTLAMCLGWSVVPCPERLRV